MELQRLLALAGVDNVLVESENYSGLKHKQYDSSIDFTDDLSTLESAIDKAQKLVSSPAFEHWVDETESNYSRF